MHHWLCESRGFEIGKSNHRRCSVKRCSRKLTEKNLRPSLTLVFYWQFYEIFENTFFTEHFRATASDEEAWLSKILISLSFLKKIFVEIIGEFNSDSCWKKELCSSPCWPLGGTLHVNFQPRLNSTLPMVKALFVVTCLNELKIQPYGYFNPVLIRQVFTIDYVKLRRNHAEFSRSKND